MILWIDDFREPHVIDSLDSLADQCEYCSLIEAIEDGVINVYRFDFNTKKYQKHNGVDWVAVE